MQVILYNVRRNLNRVYRLCYSFGVEKILVVNKILSDSSIRGNLFSAKGQIKVQYLNSMPPLETTVALENYHKNPIENISWHGIEYILIGGETLGLPRSIAPAIKATIKTPNNLCLTVDSSLSIALHEWRKHNVERL